MSHLSSVPSDPDELRAWLVQQGGHVDAGLRGLGNREVELPPAGEPRSLTVEVTLLDTEPRVWRGIAVPGNTTLDDVHEVLQTAMGWSDSHLHRFYAGASPAEPHFVTDDDLEEGEEGTPERQGRLDQLLREPGDTMLYTYDFGDGWEHELRLVEIGQLEEKSRPRCTDGAGACPPEDVGGTPGYAAVAVWVRGGRRPDDVPAVFESVEHALDWLPPGWDPDAFDVDEANVRLGALAESGELLERLHEQSMGALLRQSPKSMARVSEWLVAAARTTLSAGDIEAIVAPYRALLDAVGDGVELTAAGFLPPPLVQSLCPALGVDPILAGKANRESNVMPLVMFREQAQTVGLLQVSGKTLRRTPAGDRAAHDAPELWLRLSSGIPASEGELQLELGWFTLFALAGGVGRDDLFDVVHQMCAESGWVNEDDQPIARDIVAQLMWATLVALIGPRWNAREPWPAWVPAAAAALLFADETE